MSKTIRASSLLHPLISTDTDSGCVGSLTIVIAPLGVTPPSPPSLSKAPHAGTHYPRTPRALLSR
ncbi:hypothetical protein GCM10010267_14450 [Streptomyces griseorubens]|nr:hypothetical protein GCM10010267_14450 [Streptomyces griseorubens]